MGGQTEPTWEHGALTVKGDCGAWIPVAGFGWPSALISMPCTEQEGHEGPHATTVQTRDWRVTIQGERR